jgi:hypothetical protein
MFSGRITVAKLKMNCLCEFYLRCTIHYLPEGKEERSIYAPPFLKPRSHEKNPSCWSGFCLPFLLGRRGRGRLNIDVNLSRAAAKQSSSKNERQSQKQNYKNHQNSDNTCTAAATVSIVSHKAIPPVCAGGIGETNQRGMQRLLSQASDSVN